MCTCRYGFVIAVTTIDNIGLGALQPGRGFALYPVKYKVGHSGTACWFFLSGSLCAMHIGHSIPSFQRRGSWCHSNTGQQGRTVHTDWATIMLRIETCMQYEWLRTMHTVWLTLCFCFTYIVQSIPPEMEFDPNSTPPCYRTADSVCVAVLSLSLSLASLL